MKIILASQSSFRKKALDILGLQYEVIPSNIDEKSIRDPDPFKMAQKLSEAKAKAVGLQHQGLIIASDTFLVWRGKIFEKPQHLQEAYEMLSSLSGTNYTLVTGIAVYSSKTGLMHSSTEACEVYLRKLSDLEIKDYINRNSVLKFAGAHDTDGIVRFSEKVEGNCNFVTAIPMNKLIEFLQLHGVQV